MQTDRVKIIHELDEAWNSRDLDRILAFYSDDFELCSPHVKNRLEIGDGTLRGKEKVRAWWRRVLDKVPDLRSELVSVSEGVDSVAYAFKSSFSGSISVSVFWFDTEGKIRKELFHA